MRITDLLNASSIDLNAKPLNKKEAIEQAVKLMAASTKLTEARIKSNAAPFSIIITSLLKRLSAHRFRLSGNILAILSEALMVERTILRATAEEPNISSPSS